MNCWIGASALWKIYSIKVSWNTFQVCHKAATAPERPQIITDTSQIPAEDEKDGCPRCGGKVGDMRFFGEKKIVIFNYKIIYSMHVLTNVRNIQFHRIQKLCLLLPSIKRPRDLLIHYLTILDPCDYVTYIPHLFSIRFLKQKRWLLKLDFITKNAFLVEAVKEL